MGAHLSVTKQKEAIIILRLAQKNLNKKDQLFVRQIINDYLLSVLDDFANSLTVVAK